MTDTTTAAATTEVPATTQTIAPTPAPPPAAQPTSSPATTGQTIIAQIGDDFANFSTEAQSVIAALFSRVTALEGTVASLATPAGQSLEDISDIVTGALSAGATVAASATNPASAAIAIGSVAIPVTNLFVEAYDEAKGFLEGVTGQAPAAGATQAETDGAATGAATKNIFDAIADAIKSI